LLVLTSRGGNNNGDGGGIFNFFYMATLGNTLLAGNTAGSVQASGASAVAICGSTLPELDVRGTTGSLLVGSAGDDAATPCAANTINGTVLLDGNQGGLELGGNQIGGSAPTGGRRRQ